MDPLLIVTFETVFPEPWQYSAKIALEVTVPQTALYWLNFDYLSYDASILPIELSLTVDGEYIVEPTLVALLSIVIGAILLSVMLSMAGVLSAM